MKFEDLPASVQEQINEQMLHEEPTITVVLKPEHVAQMHADDAQQRFDRAQAEAAGVPLDFAQLYSKIEAEIDAFAEGRQSREVLAAISLQLVTQYVSAATEGRLRDQGAEIERLNRTLSQQATQLHNEREIHKRRGRDLDVMRAVVAGTMELARCSEYDVTDERVHRLGKIVTVWPMPEVRKTRIKIEDTHD
ncbi:hypothetical protein SEA_PIPPA_47 [Arthrobacter phage Pippa]|nr:hypothetical protein SEA_PIPPA_47 [Arthrobacter phage Pippa]